MNFFTKIKEMFDYVFGRKFNKQEAKVHKKLCDKFLHKYNITLKDLKEITPMLRAISDRKASTMIRKKMSKIVMHKKKVDMPEFTTIQTEGDYRKFIKREFNRIHDLSEENTKRIKRIIKNKKKFVPMYKKDIQYGVLPSYWDMTDSTYQGLAKNLPYDEIIRDPNQLELGEVPAEKEHEWFSEKNVNKIHKYYAQHPKIKIMCKEDLEKRKPEDSVNFICCKKCIQREVNMRVEQIESRKNKEYYKKMEEKYKRMLDLSDEQFREIYDVNDENMPKKKKGKMDETASGLQTKDGLFNIVEKPVGIRPRLKKRGFEFNHILYVHASDSIYHPRVFMPISLARICLQKRHPRFKDSYVVDTVIPESEVEAERAYTKLLEKRYKDEVEMIQSIIENPKYYKDVVPTYSCAIVLNVDCENNTKIFEKAMQWRNDKNKFLEKNNLQEYEGNIEIKRETMLDKELEVGKINYSELHEQLRRKYENSKLMDEKDFPDEYYTNEPQPKLIKEGGIFRNSENDEIHKQCFMASIACFKEPDSNNLNESTLPTNTASHSPYYQNNVSTDNAQNVTRYDKIENSTSENTGFPFGKQNNNTADGFFSGQNSNLVDGNNVNYSQNNNFLDNNINNYDTNYRENKDKVTTSDVYLKNTNEPVTFLDRPIEAMSIKESKSGDISLENGVPDKHKNFFRLYEKVIEKTENKPHMPGEVIGMQSNQNSISWEKNVGFATDGKQYAGNMVGDQKMMTGELKFNNGSDTRTIPYEYTSEGLIRPEVQINNRKINQFNMPFNIVENEKFELPQSDKEPVEVEGARFNKETGQYELLPSDKEPVEVEGARFNKETGQYELLPSNKEPVEVEGARFNKETGQYELLPPSKEPEQFELPPSNYTGVNSTETSKDTIDNAETLNKEVVNNEVTDSAQVKNPQRKRAMLPEKYRVNKGKGKKPVIDHEAIREKFKVPIENQARYNVRLPENIMKKMIKTQPTNPLKDKDPFAVLRQSGYAVFDDIDEVNKRNTTPARPKMAENRPIFENPEHDARFKNSKLEDVLLSEEEFEKPNKMTREEYDKMVEDNLVTFLTLRHQDRNSGNTPDFKFNVEKPVAQKKIEVNVEKPVAEKKIEVNVEKPVAEKKIEGSVEKPVVEKEVEVSVEMPVTAEKKTAEDDTSELSAQEKRRKEHEKINAFSYEKALAQVDPAVIEMLREATKNDKPKSPFVLDFEERELPILDCVRDRLRNVPGYAERIKKEDALKEEEERKKREAAEAEAAALAKERDAREYAEFFKFSNTGKMFDSILADSKEQGIDQESHIKYRKDEEPENDGQFNFFK